MRDRWQNRADTKPGQGTIYWHILLQDQPDVLALTDEAQERLSSFPGLHMTPRERLHITTLLAGPANSISVEQTTQMLEEARGTLASVRPISVTLGHILYHPEAIMLGVHPQGTLDPILDGVRAATRNAIREEGVTSGAFSSWTPHITMAYSTADQPAAPIINMLGRELPTCTLVIDAVSLVIQWGPERLWNWEILETIRLIP
jgi:2'-5' RNA ligase